MFTSLKAVAYRVEDLPKAKEWYGALLGKAPILDTPFAVVFLVGDAALSLVPGVPTAAGPIVYWGVDDADAARERLIAAGATARGEIVVSGLGNRSGVLVDPFGNTLGVTCTPSEDKRKTLREQASDSALGVALFRAMAARDPHQEIRGGDWLAEKFLSEQYRTMLDNPAGCEWLKKQTIGSYEFFLARTAYFDGAVRDAAQMGIGQIVVLGAGYDSRAWRFGNKGGQFFEVDVESTQTRKRTILRESGINEPSTLTFITVDFSRDDLGEALERGGFNRSQAAMFLWEGVTYYLSGGAVDRTLAEVRKLATSDSVLYFDYMLDAPDLDTRHGVAQSRALMKSRYQAEPIQTRIPEGTIDAFLGERGFHVIEHVTPEDMERRFLTLADGTSLGKVLAAFCLVRAAIND